MKQGERTIELGAQDDSVCEVASVCFIGPFPPPVHGQAFATDAIARALRDVGIYVKKFDVAASRGPTGLLIKILRHLLALVGIVRSRKGGAVYISVNANIGIYLTTILVVAARLRASTLYLHHHSYSHIRRRTIGMAALSFLAGKKARHITQCARMSYELSDKYQPVRITYGLSNAVFVCSATAEVPCREKRTDATIVFGHMSNLCEEKGIGRVIQAFRYCVERGLDCRLVIAGPFSDRYSQLIVEQEVMRNGDAVEYIGKVSGVDKEQFFARVDLFLFPSLYDNETQGIVNLEALSYGVPVCALAQCCIESDIGEQAGLVASSADAYSSTVYRLAVDVLNDRPGASRAAKGRFDLLQGSSQAELQKIMRDMVRS